MQKKHVERISSLSSMFILWFDIPPHKWWNANAFISNVVYISVNHLKWRTEKRYKCNILYYFPIHWFITRFWIATKCFAYAREVASARKCSVLFVMRMCVRVRCMFSLSCMYYVCFILCLRQADVFPYEELGFLLVKFSLDNVK